MIRRVLSRIALVPLLLLSACAGGDAHEAKPAGPSSAHFALTNAAVVIPGDDEYPLNLIFVAPSGDPIWTDLEYVEIPGVQEYGRSELVVNESDVEGDVKLGNVTLALPARAEAVEFDHVVLGFAGSTAPETRAIGSWSVGREGAVSEETPVQQVGDYYLSLDRCEPVSIDIENRGDVSVSSLALAFEAPGVQADAAPVAREGLAPGEVVAATSSPSCDEDLADFYILSPVLTWTSEGSEGRASLPPLSVGLINISQEKIDAIAER